MRKTAFTSATLLMIALMMTAPFMLMAQTDVWTAPESAKNVKNPFPADSASLAGGKKVYTKECLSCHGKKGLGDGPNAITLDKAPQQLNSAKVKSQTDGELFWKIKEGKKPMPSTKLTLTDEQRWEVINYIRTLSNPSKK